MARINIIKEAVMLCKHSRITPMIWGHRGLGKSSLVRQLCTEYNMGFIDLRCSQLEASDLRGLPDAVNGRTKFLPPAEMPTGDLSDEEYNKMLGTAPDPNSSDYRGWKELELCSQGRRRRGILLLDEVNRAQDDVLQAIFELILDYKIGQYPLPDEWGLVCAGNYMEGDYQVSGFNDAAFLSRFCHLQLSGGESHLDDWVNYMSRLHNSKHATAVSRVVEFATQNIDHLYGKVTGSLGFTIQPSPRSWDMVVRVIAAAEANDISSDAQFEAIAGLVGVEMASTFQRYNCPVKPAAVLADGVKRWDGELKKLKRNQLMGLMYGIISLARDRVDADDKIGETCVDFAEWMSKSALNDRDLVVAFCRSMVIDSVKDATQSKIVSAMITNAQLARAVAEMRKKTGKTTKSFFSRLSERPALQDTISSISWGR